MANWSDEIRIASTLARQAGEVIMNIYKKDFSVSYKGTNDPVTEADQQANTLIVKGLMTAFPNDHVVAEESPLPLEAQTTGRVWYVDPLDGTKEFISRNGEFSIMIGLTLNAKTQLGVVFWPTEDQLFAGITDQEAWMEHQGIRNPLKATQTKSPSALSIVASRSHRSPHLSAIKEKLNIQEEHPMGSVGLKIGFIAKGGADFYMEPGPYTKAWDACAPEAILRGAGGCFTDVHGNPIQYGTNEFRNLHGIVGSTKDCHERVLKTLTGLCSTCDG
jgi:3'(2'), 5'-bisphosphate nucleotidase